MCSRVQEALRRQWAELNAKQDGLDKERAKQEALQEELKAQRVELADKVRAGWSEAPPKQAACAEQQLTHENPFLCPGQLGACGPFLTLCALWVRGGAAAPAAVPHWKLPLRNDTMRAPCGVHIRLRAEGRSACVSFVVGAGVCPHRMQRRPCSMSKFMLSLLVASAFHAHHSASSAEHALRGVTVRESTDG